MAMALKFQQKTPTTKSLSPKAKPFSPSSSFLPHRLYPPPPPAPPSQSPAVGVVPPPVQPVFFYAPYQPVRYHPNSIKIAPPQFYSHYRYCYPNPNFIYSPVKPPVTYNCFNHGGDVGVNIAGYGDYHGFAKRTKTSNKVGFRNISGDVGVNVAGDCHDHGFVERTKYSTKVGPRKTYRRPVTKSVNRQNGCNRVVAGEYRVKQNGALSGQKPRVADFRRHRDSNTTVMVRNIPNKLRRDELITILDRHCRFENEKAAKRRTDRVLSGFDFVYLPIDFWNLGNKGYAFVNFTTGVAAARFRDAMMSRKWAECSDSKKQCDFSVARIQGLDALVHHFSCSRFPTWTEEYLPVTFSPARDGMNPGSVPRLVGNCYARELETSA